MGQSISLPVVWTIFQFRLYSKTPCNKVPSQGHLSQPHAPPKKGPGLGWLYSEVVQILVALRTVMAGTVSLQIIGHNWPRKFDFAVIKCLVFPITEFCFDSQFISTSVLWKWHRALTFQWSCIFPLFAVLLIFV